MTVSTIRAQFPLGSVVRLNAAGRTLHTSTAKQLRNGSVRGYMRNGQCVRIVWNGRTSADNYHHDFLELTPQERVVDGG